MSTKGVCFEVILEAATNLETMRFSCPERNDRGTAPSARAQPQRVVSDELSNRSFKYLPNIRSKIKHKLLHYHKMAVKNIKQWSRNCMEWQKNCYNIATI